jgi:hypothetical protein
MQRAFPGRFSRRSGWTFALYISKLSVEAGAGAGAGAWISRKRIGHMAA